MKIKKIYSKILAATLSLATFGSIFSAYAEPTEKLDVISKDLVDIADVEMTIKSLSEDPEYPDMVRKFFKEEKERFENEIGEGHFKFNCDPFECRISTAPSKSTLDLALIYAIYLSNINHFFEEFPGIKNEFLKIVTTTTDSGCFIISDELYDRFLGPCAIQFPTDSPLASSAKKRPSYLGRQNCILFIDDSYFLEDIEGGHVLSELIRNRMRGNIAGFRSQTSKTIYCMIGADAARIIGKIIQYTYTFNEFSNTNSQLVEGISKGMPGAIKTFRKFEKEASKQIFRKILGGMPAANDGATRLGILTNMPNFKKAEGISNLYSFDWLSNIFTHFWCHPRSDDWGDGNEWSATIEWTTTMDSHLRDWVCELDGKLWEERNNKTPQSAIDELQGNMSLCQGLPTSFDC